MHWRRVERSTRLDGPHCHRLNEPEANVGIVFGSFLSCLRASFVFWLHEIIKRTAKVLNAFVSEMAFRLDLVFDASDVTL